MSVAVVENDKESILAAPPAPATGKSVFKNLHTREFIGHKKKVHSVAWNCLGKKLASGSVDQTARIWHIEPHGHVCVPDHGVST
jgi:WD40 repeat protein